MDSPHLNEISMGRRECPYLLECNEDGKSYDLCARGYQSCPRFIVLLEELNRRILEDAVSFQRNAQADTQAERAEREKAHFARIGAIV